MSVIASDNFNRADGGLGANWMDQLSGISIVSNKIQGGGGAHQSQFWNADVFPDDQYSQVKYGGAPYVAPTVRAAGTAGSTQWYAAFYTGSSVQKYVGGSAVLLGSLALSPSAGDTIRLEVSGTTLRVYVNGVQDGSDQTDATFSSGSAGVDLYGAPTADDWEGGDLTVPTMPLAAFDPHLADVRAWF